LKEIIILLVALSFLTFFLGIFLGGGFTYWYMPRTCSKITEVTSVEYQCYDGSSEDSVEDCPEPDLPECKDGSKSKTVNNTVVVRQCDCLRDCPMCQNCVKPGVTTTTIKKIVLPPCASDSDCGATEYSEIKCNIKRQMYKLLSEPFCDDGECKTRQEQEILRSCTQSERCQVDVGCVPYEDSEED